MDRYRVARRTVLRAAAGAFAALATACTRTGTPPPTPVRAAPTPQPRRLGSPACALQHTPATDDLAADGYSWANARPLLLDRSGTPLALAQRFNGVDKYHTVVFADGNGVWRDSTLAARGQERGTAVYDPVGDRLHVLWKGIAATDGIRYCRYTIARDDRDAIAAITPDAAIDLQLDGQTTGTMQYEHPLLLWCGDPAFGPHGALVAAWSARNSGTGGTGNEVRAAQCRLGDSGAGAQPADWSPVATASVSTIGNPPRVGYTALVANRGAGIVYPSLGRARAGTQAGDLCLAYHDGGTVESPGGTWLLRRARWNTPTGDWRSGLSEPLTLAPLAQDGVDSGYGLKRQLGTAVVTDPAGDRVFVGFPLWRGERGDTWAFAVVDGREQVTVVEVYNASGAHSYAPTGDIAYDAGQRRLVVAYCATGTQAVVVRAYDGTAPAGEAVVAFEAAPADIPLLVEGASGGDGERVPLLLRDTVHTPAEPYHGWYGALRWRAP
jgi:hypothetical protein